MGDRMVLAYGDSNTHGTVPMETLEDMGRLGPAERWPGVLAAELGAGWLVREEGLPGRTTVHPDPISGVHKNGLAILPAILESHRPIDVVVLMLGTNDLKHRFQVPVVEIANSASLLVHAIRHSYAGPGMTAAGGPPRRAAADPRGGLPRRDLRGRRRSSRSGWPTPTPPSPGGTASAFSTRAR